MRSYVVKRLAHLRHSRRRRMVSPLRPSRESITLSSRCAQKGHFTRWFLLVLGAYYRKCGAVKLWTISFCRARGAATKRRKKGGGRFRRRFARLPVRGGGGVRRGTALPRRAAERRRKSKKQR